MKKRLGNFSLAKMAGMLFLFSVCFMRLMAAFASSGDVDTGEKTGIEMSHLFKLAYSRLSASAEEYDSAKPPLLFLGNHTLPPMIYFEKNKPAGIVVDIAEAIKERMTRPVRFRYMDWTEAQRLVLAGKADALLQINATKERRKLYDFSAPLLESEFSIFISAGRDGIYDIASLRRLTVGVEEKGLPINILKRDPLIKTVIIPDIVRGFHLLADGAVDAVVADRWVGSFVLAENNIRGIRIAGEAIEKSDSAIAVRKGNTELLTEINRALAEIRGDGTYTKILAKWQHAEVIFQTRKQYLKQKFILAAILCVLIIMLILSLFLLNEIRKRKKAAEQARNMAIRAEKASAYKSEFLANMSHELRTPLNAILGFARIMDRSGAIPPEEKENLAIIRRSGENLLNLINDVLDMSKIEAGRTVLSEKDFDLYRVLDDVESIFCLKAEEKGLQLVFECDADVPQHIRTDEGKLRQVLVNLLGNALKFTNEGSCRLTVDSCRLTVDSGRLTVDSGRLTVDSGRPSLASDNKPETTDDRKPSTVNRKPSTVNRKPETGNRQLTIRFEVEDTGEGIAPDELDSLFDVFAQTETGRKSQEGTGLGLAISRKFVQMMGGDITVESEVGKGTLFRFEIRVEPAEDAEIETARPKRRVIALEPGQPRYRILVADDRESNRLLMMRLLVPLGFDLREAENGKDAVEIWEEWEPHLICMDMRMPVTDGYEATKRIKGTTKGQATAIIAVTASAFEEERAVVLSAGCDDFVRKPFRESEMFDVLHRHLGVRYVYEEDEGRDAGNGEQDMTDALTPAAIAALPAALRNALEDAAARIDMEMMDGLLDEVRSRNASLARGLAALVGDFRYDKILALFQKRGKENKDV
ncbi:transporter substrate-binding domain-containing protein [Desulfobacterales bacterium HSG2]|nr:transporter substrate-binding domain-containing protein [Desulfobacterales bacterium HSG2]